MSKIKILTLYIGNPSIDRAKIQAQWIENRSEDVFILTETKSSKGCDYISDYFQQNEISLFSLNTASPYNVFFPKSMTGDLGVMIISKLPITNTYSMFNKENAFFSRFAGCDLNLNGNTIRLIGLYVPSRDRSPEKINRKKTFCVDVANHIKSLDKEKCIICGDFNILDRNHIPHYNTFFEWEYAFYDFFYKNSYIDTFKLCHPDVIEYSWVGRTDDGYRYDFFCEQSNGTKHNQ